MFRLLIVLCLGPLMVDTAGTQIVLKNQSPNSTVYLPTRQNVNLVCTVNLNMTIMSTFELTTVRWFKDGESICTMPLPLEKFRARCEEPRNKHVLLLNEEDKANIRAGSVFNMTLIVKNFASPDVGTYWCAGEDQPSLGGLLAGPLKLAVLTAPDIDDPQCSINHKSMSFEDGMLVAMSCVLPGGSPPPLLTWFRKSVDGKTIPMSNDRHLNNLTIFHVIKANDNKALFTCSASHPSYSSVRNCSIGPMNVLYAPRVALVYTYDDYAGNNSSLSYITCICQADSNPPSTKFTWSIENLEFASISTDTDNASVLHIYIPKSSHEFSTEARKPAVTCEATNIIDIGSETVNVNLPDVMTEPSESQSNLTSLPFLGPVIGAFFAGVIISLIICTIVYVIRIRRRSFGLRQPNTIVYSDESNSVTVRPYYIGYIRDGQATTNTNETPGQPVYEDMQGQVSTEPMLNVNPIDDSRYTPLIQGEHPDSYEKLQHGPGGNDYEDTESLNYAEPDQFVANGK